MMQVILTLIRYQIKTSSSYITHHAIDHFLSIFKGAGTKSDAVVNSIREWVIRKKDIMNFSSDDLNGAICIKLRPDGTWDEKPISCE